MNHEHERGDRTDTASQALNRALVNFVNNATHRRRRPHRDARLVFNARFRMFNKLVAKRIYTEFSFHQLKIPTELRA